MVFWEEKAKAVYEEGMPHTLQHEYISNYYISMSSIVKHLFIFVYLGLSTLTCVSFMLLFLYCTVEGAWDSLPL